MSEKIKFIVSTFMGLMVLVIVIASEMKVKGQRGINYKNLFIIVGLLGIIMCCIGKAVQVNGWTNPFAIICSLLGVAALVFIITFLAGKVNIDKRTVFRILYSIILTKWGLTTIHHIINLSKMMGQ